MESNTQNQSSVLNLDFKVKNSFKKKENQKKYLKVVATVLITATVITTFYQFLGIPLIKNQVREETIREIDVNAMPKVPVVVVKDGVLLNKYTLITDEIIKNSLEVRMVPQDFAVQNPAPNLDVIKGKVTTVNFVGNSQMSNDYLIKEEDWFGDFDRQKEYEITNTVAGTVKVGNLVDVVVIYGDGKYDVVLAKKKVVLSKHKGMNGVPMDDGVNTNTLNSTTMVFEVDEKEFSNLEMAKTQGKLEVRTYLDEKQPASTVTFSNSYRKTVDMNKEVLKNKSSSSNSTGTTTPHTATGSTGASNTVSESSNIDPVE